MGAVGTRERNHKDFEMKNKKRSGKVKTMSERIKAYWQKRRYKRERKKFIRKWNEGNKNWCECRHKRKAFKRAMIKNGYTM